MPAHFCPLRLNQDGENGAIKLMMKSKIEKGIAQANISLQPKLATNKLAKKLAKKIPETNDS